MATCPICTRDVYAPYRRHDRQGKIIEGCIHPCHDSHLIGESLRWAKRKEVRELRKRLVAKVR